MYVAIHPASRLEVINLRDCPSAVDAVRALADASNVELELLPRPGVGSDVAVRAR
jgi:hypothetical protein